MAAGGRGSPRTSAASARRRGTLQVPSQRRRAWRRPWWRGSERVRNAPLRLAHDPPSGHYHHTPRRLIAPRRTLERPLRRPPQSCLEGRRLQATPESRGKWSRRRRVVRLAEGWGSAPPCLGAASPPPPPTSPPTPPINPPGADTAAARPTAATTAPSPPAASTNAPVAAGSPKVAVAAAPPPADAVATTASNPFAYCGGERGSGGSTGERRGGPRDGNISRHPALPPQRQHHRHRRRQELPERRLLPLPSRRKLSSRP